MEKKKTNRGLRWLPPEERFWRQVDKSVSQRGCWIWTGSQYSFGYGCIRVNKKAIGAHRFSYMLIHGDIPEGKVIRHKCDIPLCVNPDHLEIGTTRDNVMDCVLRGRHKSAVLTPKQVYEIRKYHLIGIGGRTIARMFNVDERTVQRAAKLYWTHVPWPEVVSDYKSLAYAAAKARA